MNIHNIISASVEAGATAALIKAGLANPLITHRQAEKTFGKWFITAVKAGKIHHCKMGDGAKHATRWYSVNAINAMLLADIAEADIVWD
jgi:hypothetical protein